jgi:hypothetical protein
MPIFYLIIKSNSFFKLNLVEKVIVFCGKKEEKTPDIQVYKLA